MIPKKKERVHGSDFIGTFLKENVKHRVFLIRLGIRHGEYFSEYCNYFGRSLRPNKSMYGMTYSGILFYDDLNNWLIGKAGFKQSQCQIYI